MRRRELWQVEDNPSHGMGEDWQTAVAAEVRLGSFSTGSAGAVGQSMSASAPKAPHRAISAGASTHQMAISTNP